MLPSLLAVLAVPACLALVPKRVPDPPVAPALAVVPHSVQRVVVPQATAPPASPPWSLNGWLQGLSWPWPCLAWYESTDNPSAVNSVSGDGGLWQIAPSTWAAYGGFEFAPLAQDASPQAQLAVAQRIAQGQGWQAWETAPLCGA